MTFSGSDPEGRRRSHLQRHDLRAVSLFAEHAAIAVANARLYEAERALSVQLSIRLSTTP